MNKFYFTLLVFFFLSANCFASTYTLSGTSEWDGTTWSDASTVWSSDGSTASPPNYGTGTIYVESGAVMIVSEEFNWNGTIYVESGGSLIFNRDEPKEGSIVMSDGDNSMIILKKDAIIDSNGPAGHVHNYLTIGTATISGAEIDNIDTSKETIVLTEASLKGGGEPVSTLPVNILYFRSQNNTQGIQVEWASTEEWNFSHYTVERSDNGRDFTAIHEEYVNEVESTSLQTYQFLDQSPLHGANYYRLKTTDIDGTTAYKGIIMAYAGISGQMRVSPNPARGGQITIHYPGATAEGSWLSIMTSNGHEIMKIQIAEKELRLPADSLAPGIYIITVSNQLETKQQRLIVQ